MGYGQCFAFIDITEREIHVDKLHTDWSRNNSFPILA